MKIVYATTYEDMSLRVATIVADKIRFNPRLVIALPTGATPLGTFRELARMHHEELLDFSGVTSFNIDEYVPLCPDDPRSFFYFLHDNLYKEINIPSERTFVPAVGRPDTDQVCRDYEKQIERRGGIELALLGIGVNGHIGFNEPGSELSAWTHVAELSESTIETNARFFSSRAEVPRSAITMGLATILRSRKILLIANGKAKAEIMARLLNGNVVTPALPASFLLTHPDATVVVDGEAAARIAVPANLENTLARETMS
jgi:glucosamine-6-phosphate deaminase